MLPLQYLNITDKVTEFTIPEANRVVPEDQHLTIILDIHAEWCKTQSIFKYFPLAELIRLDWAWEDSSKKTLPQRIASILKKHGVVLPRSFLGALGNHVKEITPIGKPMLIDITQDFNWKAGTFRDGGSCFWNGRRDVKNAMEKDKRFYAFRMYSYENHNRPMLTLRGMLGGPERVIKHTTIPKTYNSKDIFGYARCWVYEAIVKIKTRKKTSREVVYIVFNGYGPPTREIATVLAHKAGCAARPIRLSNKGKVHGGLYFNTGSYVLGDPHVIFNMNHYDFSFQNSYDSRNTNVRDTPYQRPNYHSSRREQTYRYKRRWSDTKDTKKQKNNALRCGPQGELLSEVHYTNRGMFSDLIQWADLGIWEMPKPTVQRLYWRIAYSHTNGSFFSSLSKLINYNIKRSNNDTTSNKTKSDKTHA